jgi:hypothetical protein
LIEDEVVSPPCCLPAELLRWIVPPRKKNMRGLVLGNSLMKAFLNTARTKGLSRAYGSVTPDDAEKTPFLLDWYQRLVFSNLAPDEECIQNSAWKIEINLDPQVCPRKL